MDNMSAQRRLLVTGATGKQGGALIAALLNRPNQPFQIYALTRDRASKSAQALASQPNVHVIEGNLDDAEAVVRQVGKPWGLFSVTMLTTKSNAHTIEEQQGKAMTKAAMAAGVQHIVFTATDRGGPIKSDATPTIVPHFASKYNIEQDIKEKASSSSQGTTWTFLRPVAFFENLTNDFLGKGFIAMWRLNGLDRPLQMISTKDIGKVAADAFLNAEKEEYCNKAISIAGDEISPNQAAKVFKEETGQEIPSTFAFVGRSLKWAIADLGFMFNWFKTDDFGVDVKAIRQRYPFMQDFRTWVAEESAWKKR